MATIYDPFGRPVDTGGNEVGEPPSSPPREPEAQRWQRFGVYVGAVAAFGALVTGSVNYCNRQIAVREARANVAVNETMAVEPCPPAIGSRIILHVTNSGKLTARHLRTHAQAAIINASWPDELRLNRKPFEDGSVSVLPPGGQMEISVPLDSAIPPGFRLFIYGLLEYDNGLGTMRHCSFCARYEPLAPQKYYFAFCPRFNDCND